jgi:hypothetical protein
VDGSQPRCRAERQPGGCAAGLRPASSEISPSVSRPGSTSLNALRHRSSSSVSTSYPHHSKCEAPPLHLQLEFDHCSEFALRRRCYGLAHSAKGSSKHLLRGRKVHPYEAGPALAKDVTRVQGNTSSVKEHFGRTINVRGNCEVALRTAPFHTKGATSQATPKRSPLGASSSLGGGARRGSFRGVPG